MSLNQLSPFSPRQFQTITIVLAALVIVSLTPLNSLAQKDFLPPEIQDVQSGMPSSQVIDKIKNSGAALHVRSPLTTPKREKNETGLAFGEQHVLQTGRVRVYRKRSLVPGAVRAQ